MTLSEDQKRAVLIDCSKCMTDPGEPCWDDEGTETVPIHDERVQDARRLVEKGEKAYA